MKKIIQIAMRTPSLVAIGFITVYQKTLSPDHGIFKMAHPYGFCRHYPSCSEYFKQAIFELGLVKGLYFGAKRIVKCNPWATPKIDLVPKAGALVGPETFRTELD